MLEDSAIDAEIIQRLLLKEIKHCVFNLVMTKNDFLEALDQFKPDLILSDNTLPQFNATEALEIFHQRDLHIPFILVTGTVSEEFAAGIIKLGADDYILKDRLKRLPGAIDAALQNKKNEAAIRHSEEIRSLVMNSALDAIVFINRLGVITVWNPQAEKMFGWKETEVMGKELTETIIPEHYREAHTNGFANYLITGKGPVLNRVIEVTALNAAGNEFPVELAVVPIKQPGDHFACAFIRDISERRKAEDNLKAMEKKVMYQKIQEQKKIARAIIKAQEAEKNRIGQELHDNVTQILAGTKIYLSIASKKNETTKDLLKYPIELLDNSIEEIRMLSHKQVTPLNNVNLEGLTKEIIKNLSQNKKIKTNFTYSVPDELITDDLKLNIYRIIQEQINNILKHAQATKVDISIKADKTMLSVVIKDDGKGFVATKKRTGIGISNMMNRVETYNGTLTIISSPGNGCKINIEIPC